MSTNRKKILDMLEAHQISAEEAERLLAALDASPAASQTSSESQEEVREEAKPEGIRMIAGFTYRRDRTPRFKWAK